MHVLLLRGDKVLLLRRCNTGYEDGKLSVVAGHVERGETVTQAALRETREEVALTLPRDALEVVGVMHRNSTEARVDFFLAGRLDDVADEPANAEPERCSELVWARIDALPADVIPYVRDGIAGVRAGVWFRDYGWER